ncbi:MAG: META domain-containing protein [Saprospiraceae bacterium]|nr:META domain-containing protein [Saprospiraceae bacterium]
MKNAKLSFIFLSTLAVAAILGLTACQCDQSKLFNKTWVLEKYGPETAMKAVIMSNPLAKEPVLQLDGKGQFGGNDGCNGFGGVYKLGADCEISFDSIRHTFMYCGDSLIMVQSGAINDLIRDVATYEVTDSELKLSTPAKGVLVYRKK